MSDELYELTYKFEVLLKCRGLSWQLGKTIRGEIVL